MSMNRNDALAQLSAGMRQFESTTAGQFLKSDWAGVKGLHVKDLAYFNLHGEKPVHLVAQACMGRSLAHNADPLTTAP